jgi:hypothetical protein
MFHRCVFCYSDYVICCIDVDSVYQVHIIEYVSYVGFATSNHATMIILACLLKKKKSWVIIVEACELSSIQSRFDS